MRRILKTILLLAVLCLAGCKSEEEEPYLEMITDRTEVENKGGTLTVTVSSDGYWKVVMDRGNMFIDSQEGEGNATFSFQIPPNAEYDDVTYTLTAKSGNGLMSDTESVRQKAAIGMSVNGVSRIPEGGANIDVPVRTNDRITSVDTPDWITLTSSRALTEYTYTFKVDTNRTGAVRTGTIRFNGSETGDSIEVKQDSYGPSGILMKGDTPLYTTQRTVSIPFGMIPEYADPTKLTVKAKSNCTAGIEDGCLVMNPQDYGIFTAAFYHKNTELHSVSSELFPENPLNMSPSAKLYLGQLMEMYYTYYSEDYVLESNSPGAVRTEGNRIIRAVGLGSGTVTASHPGLGTSSSVSFSVEPFFLAAETPWASELKGNLYEVSVQAVVKCAPSTDIAGFLLTAPDGRIIFFNEGIVTRNGDTVTIGFGTLTVRLDRSKYGNIHDAMKRYKVTVTAEVEGTPYPKTAVVNGASV